MSPTWGPAVREPPGSFGDLAFASSYVYAPRAVGWLARSSRLVCARVKAIDPLWLPGYAGWVYRSSLQDRQLASIFACGAVLVPVPGSARTTEGPWAALALAVALARVGFALPVCSVLWRRYGVRKSATAPSSARPTVQQHYDSFGVLAPAMPMRKVVLIDDVITKGRTLLAAAARVHAAAPCADIRAFALIRTLGFACNIERVAETCHGMVRWTAGDARREP